MTVDEKGAVLFASMAKIALTLDIDPADFIGMLAEFYSSAIDAYVDEFGVLPPASGTLH